MKKQRSEPYTLTLGLSPCPNDCFIFDALLHGKIDTEGIRFRPVMEDVEALNRRAARTQLDITKLSFFAFSKLRNQYSLLDSGAALGNGVGPLLVAGKRITRLKLSDPSLRVAIPGKSTTANMLFSLAYPHLNNKKELIFSRIEDAVAAGKFDLGVIIHEGRFTYRKKGLIKLHDLGEFWEQRTGLPIPLGGIVIRKDLGSSLKTKVERIIRRSVQYAFEHPRSSREFVKAHAQEMEDHVIRRHIRLYVNNYSVSLGKKGTLAVKTMLQAVR